MKLFKLFYRAAAVAAVVAVLALAGCKTNNPNENNNQKSTDMSTQQTLNEVAGRKNFGPQHALMTTPQPCVMIATWDKDHTPDVMMAAWAGQLDYNQIRLWSVCRNTRQPTTWN